jgi:nitrogen fixation protein NifB
MSMDTTNHPCFDPRARHEKGRVHLPVAPRCNIQCNFCNRKYDCVNESRPGVTSTILTPKQAAAYLVECVKKRLEIAVAGIAGPGDPFANPQETMETLRLVRKQFPEMLLCVATNGLEIGPYIEEMAELKVSHVTVTICAVDPVIGAKVYAWVRDGKRPLRGEAAAALMIERQLDAVARLKARGILVKINAILIPGVNDTHLKAIARQVAEFGADMMNCVPLKPVQGSEFECIAEPDAKMTARVRIECGTHVPQMTHCARCRADAAGFINETMTPEQIDLLQHHASMNPDGLNTTERPYVAVASQEAALVNLHLGETERLLIYEKHPEQPGAYRVKEIRKAPESGGGDARWEALADLLSDCRAILVTAAGPSPSRVFERKGLRLVEMEGIIEDGLQAVFSNQAIPASMKRRFMGCSTGISCKGTGTGCG